MAATMPSTSNNLNEVSTDPAKKKYVPKDVPEEQQRNERRTNRGDGKHNSRRSEKQKRNMGRAEWRYVDLRDPVHTPD